MYTYSKVGVFESSTQYVFTHVAHVSALQWGDLKKRSLSVIFPKSRRSP